MPLKINPLWATNKHKVVFIVAGWTFEILKIPSHEIAIRLSPESQLYSRSDFMSKTVRMTHGVAETGHKTRNIQYLRSRSLPHWNNVISTIDATRKLFCFRQQIPQIYH